MGMYLKSLMRKSLYQLVYFIGDRLGAVAESEKVMASRAGDQEFGPRSSQTNDLYN